MASMVPETLKVNAQGIFQKLLREGRLFRRILGGLEESQWYEREQLEALQHEKLRRVIDFAYKQVPYYREVFDERGLKPEDIRTSADLPKLPLLTKAIVKDRFDLLVAKNANRFLLRKGYTSGTTGTPAKFYRDLYSINFEHATIWRHWHWGGFGSGQRRVTLRGDRVVPITRREPPFWCENLLGKQLLMSSFHLSDAFLPLYVEKIRSYRPYMMQAYPSTAYLFARHLAAAGQKLMIPLVFTASEPLYPVQRELIEERLGCTVFDFYGLAERTVFASECEAHSGLHLNPEYGITELVDDGGNPVAHGSGRIVGTTLNNSAMPLIRYLTDDISERLSGECSCGRHFERIKPVETKCEDLIVTPDGRCVSPSLITFCFKPLFNIKKSQILQDAPDHLTIRIVKRETYSDADSANLVARIKDATDSSMKIDLEFVEDIPRTSAGKYRWIISEVPETRNSAG